MKIYRRYIAVLEKLKTSKVFKLVVPLFTITLLLGGLATVMVLVRSPQDIREKAAGIDKKTYEVGSLGERTFYRTDLLKRASPMYGRTKKIPQGIYDPSLNKTYIVYSGGIVSRAPPIPPPPNDLPNPTEFSATDPHIVAFDHNSKTWEGPVRIAKLNKKSDAHNYPQIVIDEGGYLHVFHSFHVDGNIFYARSKKPGDITDWEHSIIPGTNKSTYVAAFTDNQGEIYLFYRSSEYWMLYPGCFEAGAIGKINDEKLSEPYRQSSAGVLYPAPKDIF